MFFSPSENELLSRYDVLKGVPVVFEFSGKINQMVVHYVKTILTTFWIKQKFLKNIFVKVPILYTNKFLIIFVLNIFN